MSRINLRALLVRSSGAVIASTDAASAVAREPSAGTRKPSNELRALFGDCRA